MTDIEANSTSATRKTSGAKFSVSIVPPHISRDQCLYTNPAVDIEVGFSARWICDRKRTGKDGNIIQGVVLLGIILEQGQLRQRIEGVAGQRLSKADVDALVNDCYELMIEFIRMTDERQDKLGIQPHIYEVSRSQFGTFSWSSVEVPPDVIVSSGAVQIL